MNEHAPAAGTHVESAPEQHHEHHWETSWAPLAIVAGVFFSVILAFSAHFQYEDNTLTMVFMGIGVPLLLAGIAKWTDEGLSQTPLIANVASVGLPIFIVSEVFIFLALFTSYWMMRLSFHSWPPEGTPEIELLNPAIMTVLLVSSSVTIHIGEEKLDHGDHAGFNKWLIITILLGATFLGFTVAEYHHLVGLGFVPSTNAYSTAFYAITGFHASHVFVGLATFLAVLIPSLRGRTNRTFVFCASVYWHFVDVVWFFVASQIYFW